MALHMLIKTLQTSGVKLAMGDGAYATPNAPQPEVAPQDMPVDPGSMEGDAPPPPGLWDQYKIPAMVAGGALLGGLGIHYLGAGKGEAANAATAAQHSGESSKVLEAARASGAQQANNVLKLSPADLAQGRPEGLLNSSRM